MFWKFLTSLLTRKREWVHHDDEICLGEFVPQHLAVGDTVKVVRNKGSWTNGKTGTVLRLGRTLNDHLIQFPGEGVCHLSEAVLEKICEVN